MLSLYTVLNAAENSAKTNQAKHCVQEVQFYDTYSEPGYSLDENKIGIAISNWNSIGHWDEDERKFIEDDKTMPRLADILTHMGYELEWDDEWVACEICNGLVRCNADSYHWQKSYWENEGIVCIECLKNDPDLIREMFESLENNPKQCNTLNINPEDYDYVLINDEYEHGFHRGQDSDPELIAKALHKQGITRFLFHLTYTSQFDMGFAVYIHESQKHLLTNVQAISRNKTNGSSIAGALEKGLREASLQQNQLSPTDGVIYSRITPESTKTCIIPRGEFIEHGINNVNF